jgi:hypothetical protein
MSARNALARWTFVVAIAASGIAAGCSSSSTGASTSAPVAPRSSPTCEGSPPPVEEPDENTKLPPFEGPMVLVQPSTMLDRLRATGLDPKNLPPFEKLERHQLGVVMKTFAASLGLKCIGCHDLENFKKPSPRKEASKRMWNEFVRVLVLEDGSPVYCDSCHQGSVQVLDRRDKGLVSSFMDEIFVGKMKRADGKEHECGTCHGDPPDFKFLSTWRKRP